MVPCRNAAEQQILLSQNGALVNVVYHMRNPDTNQLVSPGIMHEIWSIGYFSGESLKLIPADVRLKCTKFDFRLGSQLQRSPDPS